MHTETRLKVAEEICVSSITCEYVFPSSISFADYSRWAILSTSAKVHRS